MNEEESSYQRARQQVQEIKDFYQHLFIYIVINIGLFIINMLTSPKSLWFYWPLIGWGIGLLAHAFKTFGTERYFGRDWEVRKIREIMEKEKKKKP